MPSTKYLGRLSEQELARMRLLLLEELASAVRGRADAEHLAGVSDLLTAVDVQIARRDIDRQPSPERRQRLASEKRPSTGSRG